MDPNVKKATQLGESYGAAQGRLKKQILFGLLERLDLTVCYRCSKRIRTIEELSIEHKEPWLDSADPIGLFFDSNNIAFSHLSCNVAAARKANKYPTEEERIAAKRKNDRESQKRIYTPEKRHEKFLRSGY